MPTVHHEPRMLTYPCFLKILQRTSIHNSTAIVFLLNLCSPLVSSRLHFHNKKYFCGLLHVFMQHIGTSCCPLSSQVLATWRCSLLSFIPSILNGTVRINFVCDLDLYAGIGIQARRADGCIVGPMSGTAGCKWAHLNTYACNCVRGRERCLREYLNRSHAASASIRYSRTQRERLILAHRVLVRTRVKARTLVVSSVRRRAGPIRRAGARGPARPSVGRVRARCHQVFPTHACKTKANQRGTRPAWIHFSASRK